MATVAHVVDRMRNQYLPVRATEEPQYLIKSDKTDRLAMQKGSALKRSPSRKPPKGVAEAFLLDGESTSSARLSRLHRLACPRPSKYPVVDHSMCNMTIKEADKLSVEP